METKTTADFDIEKMSEDTEISIAEIKQALNIPLNGKCEAATFEEARNAYEDAPFDSEAKALAMIRWIELITTIEEAQEIYLLTPSTSEAETLALKKWEEFSLKNVNLAVALDYVLKAYKEAPERSESKALAMKKIAKFYGWQE
jgi:hypothetical protein